MATSDEADNVVREGWFHFLATPSATHHRHPEEPRSCAASRRMATGACGPSFEARREGRRAPQDDAECAETDASQDGETPATSRIAAAPPRPRAAALRRHG